MNSSSAAHSPLQRTGIALVLLFCGVLVFVLGTNYYSVFATNDSQLYRGILAALLLAAALLLRRRPGLEVYSQIAYAFFIAILTYFLTSMTAGLRDSLLREMAVSSSTPKGLMLVKLIEAAQVIGLILLLNKLWGGDLGSIYLQRGKLGRSLFVGLCMLTINTATGIVTGVTLGQAQELIISRLPWALIFSLANGLMEELQFRGLFLRPMTAVIGEKGAIVVTAVIFTVMHSAASYMTPVEAIIFQVILLPMALLFAYIMRKTDNVWGATLFHAGSDVFMFYLMGW